MKHYLDGLATLTYPYKGSLRIGANQADFKHFIARYDGCGPIAAGNIIMYLAAINGIERNGIPRPPSIGANLVLQFIDDLYSAMSPLHLYHCNSEADMIKIGLGGKYITLPPSLGTFSPRRFKRSMASAATRYRLSLHSVTLPWHLFNNRYDDWRLFIVNHLDANHPIALLNTVKSVTMSYRSLFDDNVAQRPLHLHWVVVVALEQVGEDDVLTVLTWGGLATIQLSALWRADKSHFGLNTHMIAYTIDDNSL